jgi:hypothetical protein
MAEKKKSSAKSDGPKQAASTGSKLPAGKGSKRSKTRLITIYGSEKSHKTGSLAKLIGKGRRVKWVLPDSNSIPTLAAMGSLPADEDTYEFLQLSEFREWLDTVLTIAETEGAEALGIDDLVYDSATQHSDMYQQAVAKATGQKFLGEVKEDNGWVQFNAEFGLILDLLAALSAYVNVFVIVHAKAKFDPKKGQYSSFSLSPAMAAKLGRLSNWILYKRLSEVYDEGEKMRIVKEVGPSPWYVTVTDPSDPENLDRMRVYESVFHTRPVDNWIASVESPALAAEEPGTDITLMMEKVGLM